MCIRAYLLLQTKTGVTQEKILELLNRPGIIAADVLEGTLNLMLVLEAGQRNELVRDIEQALDSVEPINDLRLFIGRDEYSPIPSAVGV